MGFGVLETTTGIAMMLVLLVFFFGRNKAEQWWAMFKDKRKEVAESGVTSK